MLIYQRFLKTKQVQIPTFFALLFGPNQLRCGATDLLSESVLKRCKSTGASERKFSNPAACEMKLRRRKCWNSSREKAY